jgi:hypothetical protein
LLDWRGAILALTIILSIRNSSRLSPSEKRSSDMTVLICVYLCLKNVCNFVKKKNRCLVTFVGEAISGTGDILEGKVSVKFYLNSFIDRFIFLMPLLGNNI